MVLEIHFKEETKVLINNDLLQRKHNQTTQNPCPAAVLYIIRYNTYYIIVENMFEPRLRSHQKSSFKPSEQHI